MTSVMVPRTGLTHRVDDSAVGDGASDSGTKGLGDRIDATSTLLSAVLADLDPDLIAGHDAIRLYRTFAEIERLSMAGKTLLAPRIEASGAWREDGHRNAAVLLASLEGVSTGQARNTLEVGQRLHLLPDTVEALRTGELSGPKLAELSGAAVLDPESETALLAGAADQPLQQVKERCRRARATAHRRDPIASVRRIYAARHFSSWTDVEGAFCYQGRDTADRGAQILEHLAHAATRLRKTDSTSGDAASTTSGREASPERQSEPERAVRADAFFALVTQQSGLLAAEAGTGAVGSDRSLPHPPDDEGSDVDTGPPLPCDLGVAGPPTGSCAVVDRPPNCSVMVRVDLAALLRGDALPGETCEIDGQGPIPVRMARDMANDSFLRLVFQEAGDIKAISHFGRTINRQLRTALAFRDRTCVVPGCGVSFGLEIDHIIPFADGGPTELDNLALLCHHHHFLKTFEGWTLERIGTADNGSPIWSFEPLPPFGQEPELGVGGEAGPDAVARE